MRISTTVMVVLTALSISVLLPGSSACAEGTLLEAELLDGPFAGVDEIIFTIRSIGKDGHWYANFGYWSSDADRMMYGRDGSQLCALNLRTGQRRDILQDPGGTIRDPHVHYDGRKILFSYRKAGSIYFHLYEINADSTGLRQITGGPFDDIEPIYMPDGEIMFCSSRCNRWVNCWHTQVAVLYRCDADGGNMRLLSANIEQDNTPWMLPDGRVLYTRWEYVDRSRVKYHHLWSMNPDGTAQMIYYGNMHPGTVMIDAKPIAGTEEIVSVFSPGHGKKEHAGAITLVNPKRGPDDQSFARKLNKKEEFRDPYPLSRDCILTAINQDIVMMNGRGQTSTLYSLAGEHKDYWLHEPRPLRPRKREPVIPPRMSPELRTGRLILADVRHGRNMDGVESGQIKKLLVLETLPKPINHSGTMEPISLGGTFTLPRILGTVPVEADGSAYMELPALRSLFFVALDQNDMSVKRMQSFLTVMPGEVSSCAGCHENRTDAARDKSRPVLMAMRRPPSKIEPVAGIPDVFDFPRDIQPILDRHCTACHNYDKREGGIVLTGDRSPTYSHSYVTLLTRHVSHGRDAGSNLPPRQIGASASRLMKLIDGSHYKAKLTPREIDYVRYWIESGAPYAGTYAALGTGMVQIMQRDEDVFVKKSKVMARRCASCHGKKFPVHVELRYNLTEPEKSLVLLAPLAAEAGGYGLCESESSRPEDSNDVGVFSSTDDPDYQELLADITGLKDDLDRRKRFDMPDFKPGEHYVREMKKYGILPADTNPKTDPIDVYALDRAYWKSLWYSPSN
ncbi:MAG: HzsA-related protein [Planctomycetota bacterium]